MFLKKCLSVVKPGLRVIFEDLRAFNAPALLLALGSCCTLLLHTWGSIYITCIMAVCTLLVYLAARKCGGWGQTFLGVVFSFFMVVVGLAAVAIRFFLYPDFSPNGKDSYTYVRRDFFPEEIPDTAYDVQVWSRVGFGPGEDEAYLSYHDTKANIRPYAAMARERSEMRTRIPRINDLISVPKVRVDAVAAPLHRLCAASGGSRCAQGEICLLCVGDGGRSQPSAGKYCRHLGGWDAYYFLLGRRIRHEA